MDTKRALFKQCAMIAALTLCVAVVADDTTHDAFTYQGQLKHNGEAMSEPVDLKFRLYSEAVGGDQMGVELAADAFDAFDEVGRFTIDLAFGKGVFTGLALWLEIEVDDVVLTPRQRVMPAPYALAMPGMRTLPNAASPNVIGGFSGNEVGPNVVGATIGGGGGAGAVNSITAHWSTIGGGVNNTANHLYSSVGGGVNNSADGESSTVSGGSGNTATVMYSTIGGGFSNTANGTFSTVCGGVSNSAYGFYSTIGGGIGNEASGLRSTIGGGHSNTASGDYSTVPGGNFNVAHGNYSLAAGFRAKADHNGTFVWGDFTTADFASTGANQFLIRAGGGIGLGTNAPRGQVSVGDHLDFYSGGGTPPTRPSIRGSAGDNLIINAVNNGDVYLNHDGGSGGVRFHDGTGSGVLMRLTPDGSLGVGVFNPAFQLQLSTDSAAKPTSNTWTVFSDARLKKNIHTIDHALDDLLALRGVTYQWKDPATQGNMTGTYTGFIAQEVEEVFPEWIAEGANGHKTLTVIGFEGLVVEALRELREEKDAEIDALRNEVDELRSLVEQLMREKGRVR